MRDQDAELFATAERISPSAVVILLTENYCGSFWWIVRTQVQALSEYLLFYVPAARRSRDSGKKLASGQHMKHGLALAARGILDVPGRHDCLREC
jgi:hypothetical protein